MREERILGKDEVAGSNLTVNHDGICVLTVFVGCAKIFPVQDINYSETASIRKGETL